MKNKYSLLALVAIMLLVVIGCNFSVGGPQLSSLETSTDKEAKEKTTKFTAGEVIYAKTEVSNNSKNVKVRFYLTPTVDLGDSKKGEMLEGSEVSLDVDGNKTAYCSYTKTKNIPDGKYKLFVEMSDDKGEKKATQSVEITVEGSENSTDPED